HRHSPGQGFGGGRTRRPAHRPDARGAAAPARGAAGRRRAPGPGPGRTAPPARCRRRGRNPRRHPERNHAMTPAFSLSGITKRYPQFALQDIALQLPEGQVMGLVGVNGAGKTTLLRLLTGLAAADAGEVRVLGHRLPQAQVAAKRDIGFASEDMRLYRTQDLRWHMALVRSAFPGWDEAYAGELLRRFELRADQPLDGFSHGQRVKA